jgi:RNA recognition motif-containing protein
MQGSKLYVGNLSYSVTNEQLEELFSSHGEVKQVNVIEGRGFGFVEMANPAEAEKAKEALDGSDFQGRSLRVDEARPPRSGGGGGGRGGGGGGGGRRDYRRY